MEKENAETPLAARGKTLAEMGVPLNGSGWAEGDQIVAQLYDRCNASEALRVVAELIQRVGAMQFAPRFSSERALETMFMPETMNPNLHGLSEAEHKRAELIMKLQEIHADLLLSFSKLGSVAVEIEVSGREF